jgi:hypothetical protein
VTPTPAEQVLVLKRCRTDDAGHCLGLRGGDVLITVDGTPWRGTATALQAHMARTGRATALGFQRAGVGFTVLTARVDLGQWARLPLDDTHTTLPDYAEGLRNWQIMADAYGNFDLFPVIPSIMALIAPPVWLAQGRLWAALVLFVMLATLALPVGVLLVAAIWVAVGVHLWRDGAGHQRVTLEMQGYCSAAILATKTEGQAIETWKSLNPRARFRFDPAQTPVLQ